MEGRAPSPQKRKAGRPGSLSSLSGSGYIAQAQRPGRLNGGASQPLVKSEDQPGPSNDSVRGPLSAAGNPDANAAPRKIFRPNIPSKHDPRRRAGSAAASSSAAAKDSQAFKELIKQAQSDKGWQDKPRPSRPQQAPIQVMPAQMSPFPASSAGQAAPGRATRGSSALGKGLTPGATAGVGKASGSLMPVREDVVMSDDEDFGEGKVLGPMLDYTRYYPTTLPMHQPRQDDSAASETSEEGSESMAQRLQLLAHGTGERLVLVQVPDLLPSEAPPLAPDPGAPRQRSLRREDLPPTAAARGLKALPSGKIGQLVVYESGAVKLRIGSVLYDLEPGISPNIREEVAGITSMGEEPACPLLGEVQQHAVITPDMDYLLSGRLLPDLLPVPGLWIPPEMVEPPMESTELAAPMDVDVKPEA